MRLWLREDERRPDPAPARADARKALAVGTVAWAVGLVVLVLAGEAVDSAGLGWLVPACWVGIVLGVAGLIVVQVHRARTARDQASSG